MKRPVFTLRRTLLALGGLALGLGLSTLSSNAAPTPDCGPTREWTCVVPHCPSCYEILFEGTVCEKNEFEKKTGRVCSPI